MITHRRGEMPRFVLKCKGIEQMRPAKNGPRFTLPAPRNQFSREAIIAASCSCPPRHGVRRTVGPVTEAGTARVTPEGSPSIPVSRWTACKISRALPATGSGTCQ